MIVSRLRIRMSEFDVFHERVLDRTLSSSIVEAANVSNMMRTASFFLVPLSLSEWANTIAPRLTISTQIHTQ